MLYRLKFSNTNLALYVLVYFHFSMLMNVYLVPCAPFQVNHDISVQLIFFFLRAQTVLIALLWCFQNISTIVSGEKHSKKTTRCERLIFASPDHRLPQGHRTGILFLHENFFKVDAVKFSLIDSPAMKNKNIRFSCPSLRNGITNVILFWS